MGLLDRLVDGRVGVDREIQDRSEVRRAIEAELGEAAIAFELDSQDAGGTQESTGSNSELTAAPEGGWMRWGQLQTEILDAIIADDDEIGGPALQGLAKRLRSSVEDLEIVMERTNPTEFMAKRLERLLQLERLRKKDVNWDVLEDAALGKLMSLMETNRINKTAELLAVAQAANRAARKPTGGSMDKPGTTLNVFTGSGQVGVELPGPGNLGTMRLTLSAKTVSQLSQGITIEAEAEKFSESVEMLDGDDVPLISKLADEV